MTLSRLKCFIIMHLYWFLQMVWKTFLIIFFIYHYFSFTKYLEEC